MSRNWRVWSALCVGVLLSACTRPADSVPEAQAASGPGDAMPPAVAPATSINAVMVGLVDHAAHHIWDAGVEGMAPATPEEWQEVAHHAIQLIAAGTAITAGGTGALDANWVRQATWQEYAQDVTNVGIVAWEAANRQDLNTLLGAGDDLIEACESCHREYKPALPTEGIVHERF